MSPPCISLRDHINPPACFTLCCSGVSTQGFVEKVDFVAALLASAAQVTPRRCHSSSSLLQTTHSNTPIHVALPTRPSATRSQSTVSSSFSYGHHLQHLTLPPRHQFSLAPARNFPRSFRHISIHSMAIRPPPSCTTPARPQHHRA
jgi:hypothetical protein